MARSARMAISRPGRRGSHTGILAHGPPAGYCAVLDLQRKDPGSRYTGYSTRVQQMMSRPEGSQRRGRGAAGGAGRVPAGGAAGRGTSANGVGVPLPPSSGGGGTHTPTGGAFIGGGGTHTPKRARQVGRVQR